MDFDSYNGIKKPGPAEKRDVFGYGHDHPGMEYSGKTHSDEDAVTCGHCGMVFQGGPMHEAKRETFDGGCKAPGYNVVLTI